MKFKVQGMAGDSEMYGDTITDEAMIAALKENPKPVILFHDNHEAVMGHLEKAIHVGPDEFELVMNLTKEGRKAAAESGTLLPAGQILEMVGDKITKFRMTHMSMVPDRE